jgi:hypothetical protein
MRSQLPFVLFHTGTGIDLLGNFLLKLLRNRKTLYCNKETDLLEQNDLPFCSREEGDGRKLVHRGGNPLVV